MISEVICHCGIGNSGGTGVRYALGRCLKPQPAWLDSRAHLPAKFQWEAYRLMAPVIGQVRNPFDWYISTWLTELRYHRWRGGFEDWFYHRKSIPYQFLREERTEGAWMWDLFLYFSEVERGQGPAYTYIMRMENLLEDLCYVLEQICPDRLDKGLLMREWPQWVSLNVRRPWVEGIEQWTRDELYTTDMIDRVYEQDGPIFERFGYTLEQHYYYGGGCGTSCHGTRLGDFEDEKQLSECWAEWESERPGPFVRH